MTEFNRDLFMSFVYIYDFVIYMTSHLFGALAQIIEIEYNFKIFKSINSLDKI